MPSKSHLPGIGGQEGVGGKGTREEGRELCQLPPLTLCLCRQESGTCCLVWAPTAEMEMSQVNTGAP